MLKWKVDVWEELQKKTDHVFNDFRKTGEISQYTLTRLHNGEVNVSTKTLNALCRILERQPGDLLEYVKEGE